MLCVQVRTQSAAAISSPVGFMGTDEGETIRRGHEGVMPGSYAKIYLGLWLAGPEPGGNS